MGVDYDPIETRYSGDDSIFRREAIPSVNNDSNASIKEEQSHIDNVVGRPDNKKNNRLLNKGFFNKKKGPIITMVVLTMLFGGGMATIGNPAFITHSIMHAIVDEFHLPQMTSWSKRLNIIAANKISENATTSTCSYTQILCRFSKPSNRFLKRLEEKGIKALEGDSKEISSSLIFPNKRPSKYSFKQRDGTVVEVKASEFYDTLVDDDDFRSAFNYASETRVGSMLRSLKNVSSRFGITLLDKLSGAKDEKSIKSLANDNIDVDDSLAKKAAKEGGEEAEDATKKLIKAEADVATTRLARAGKASAVNTVAGVVCAISSAPGTIQRINRAFQMKQLVQYSMVFLSAFGAIKAGDATEEEMTAIGDSLTKIVDGNSAMDSFGMMYIMGSSTDYNNPNYKKFIPGSSISSLLDKVSSKTDSRARKNLCNAVTSPAAGAAVETFLVANSVDTLGVSFLAALANMGLGFMLSHIIEQYVPVLVEKVVNTIDTEELMEYFIGDLTQDIEGEDIGNAIVSGASHVIGQGSNTLGNMPLSVDEAVAYEKVSEEVELAFAEEDRATLSPFDVSSKNTFMGSILYGLLPYYSTSSSNINQAGSFIANTLSVIGGIFGSSISSSIIKADDDGREKYEQCDQEAIDDEDIATGPFCNIIYGIPVEYLDKDPITIINELIASGEIDPETGDPIDREFEISDIFGVGGLSLKAWQDMCTDGSTSSLSDCKITDDNVNFALYTMDHNIQESLDGNYVSSSIQVSQTTDIVDLPEYKPESNTIISLDTQPSLYFENYTDKSHVNYLATNYSLLSTTKPFNQYIKRNYAT